MKTYKVAVIGLGRFGKLLYEKLREIQASGNLDIELMANTKQEEDGSQFNLVNFDEVKQADIIIPAVPISAFETVIQELSSGINSHAIVIDLCSVKVLPVQWMKQYLPKTVEICGTHPIFGPDSVRVNGGWRNLPMVICPVRLNPINQSLMMLLVEILGVNAVQMTPEQHDRKMAYSLLYTHLIGRIGEEMGLQSNGIDTLGFKQLLQVQQYVVNDSWQLFEDMNKYNPYAAEMRKEVRKALDKIEQKLNS